ncbi:L-erythro-3,5-diaminohexanoate dehydrogenase [soil metagenome]
MRKDGQVGVRFDSVTNSVSGQAAPPKRPEEATGDPFGTHRSLAPRGALPQPADRLDNDFTRLFRGEMLIDVETLNVDAASFRQMEEAAVAAGEAVEVGVPLRVRDTVSARGKQHNRVTGSGGMLLGRVKQLAAGRPEGERVVVGDRIATLVSLSLTPLRIDDVRAVRPVSAQLDVSGEAVIFASSPFAILPSTMPERLALAVLDVAGAAPQVTRLAKPGAIVVVLGAGGKSGILCAAEAKKCVGESGIVVGVEAHAPFADDLEKLAICNHVVRVDARDPLATRAAVLRATGGREGDLVLSCVNVADVEMSAILCTRARGITYFFAMSTSFTKAALGAEGVGKDVDLVIGNGFAEGHAEHTLRMMREHPAIYELFSRRYG